MCIIILYLFALFTEEADGETAREAAIDEAWKGA